MGYAMKGLIELEAIDLEQHPECCDYPLAIHIAKRYVKRWDGNLPGGLEIKDLVQASYMALKRAHESL